MKQAQWKLNILIVHWNKHMYPVQFIFFLCKGDMASDTRCPEETEGVSSDYANHKMMLWGGENIHQ